MFSKIPLYQLYTYVSHRQYFKYSYISLGEIFDKFKFNLFNIEWLLINDFFKFCCSNYIVKNNRCARAKIRGLKTVCSARMQLRRGSWQTLFRKMVQRRSRILQVCPGGSTVRPSISSARHYVRRKYWLFSSSIFIFCLQNIEPL